MRDRIIFTMNKISNPQDKWISFDIDDTLIHYDNPIYSILDTYKYAKQMGFKIAIITARIGIPDNIIKTQYQLHRNGITSYDCMYFLPPHIGTSEQVQSDYKISARKHVNETKGEIAISIGDMWFDMSGGYHGHGFQVTQSDW